jgi:hypothetical protein
MAESLEIMRSQIGREVSHWIMAASRLEDLENFAAPEAWDGLERYLGIAIRQRLGDAVERLQRQAAALRAAFNTAQTMALLARVRQQLVAFRQRYLRTETTLDFYADAINTRTNPEIATLLRACDFLAQRSMCEVLDQLGKPTPLVLTYLDKGLGASILKAGLRLWDGSTESPVAAIKIVRHNLYRPTSLIHEAGHQVAHITGWNEELARALESGLASPGVAEAWAGWASEIAADACAFVHTGYAAVASLHDVVAGDDVSVFRHVLGDPHPISYIRVLLGTEMCRQFFGPGPWDDLAGDWTQNYPLEKARPRVRALLRRSLPLLPKTVEITLRRPMRAFGGRPLTALIDPQRVKPDALFQLEQRVGPALYTSPHWVQRESLRLLALTGLRAATGPGRAREILKQQEAWMIKLGDALKAV